MGSQNGGAVRHGIGLFATEPARRMRELAVRAEEAGYAHAWFGDSQLLWRETYTTMAAAIGATGSITFGTGVSNLATRHVSVLASIFRTLHELGDGRVAAGFGAGDSAVHMIGRQPFKLAAIERDVARFRGLVAGETVALDEGAECRLAYGEPAHVPVYIAASGPKLLRLCGRIADGVILLVGTNPAFVEAGLRAIDEGAREVGRTRADIDVVLWTPGAVLDDGAEARHLVKTHVARVAMHPLPAELDEATQASIEEIRRRYDYGGHMDTAADHGRLVPDELVPHFAIAGTHDECVAQVDRIAATGVDEIAIVPYQPAGQGREAVISAFADVVRSSHQPTNNEGDSRDR